MSVELWLVRHGETLWSREGRLTGWSDPHIMAEGRGQAAELRPWLSTGLFTGVYSSDLRRAADTAWLAYGEPVLEPRLRELNFGALEGVKWSELETSVQEELFAFDDFAAPDGESTRQMLERLCEFFDSLAPGRYLCFCHGGPIRAVLRLLGQDRLVAPCTVAGVDWSDKKFLFLRGSEEMNREETALEKLDEPA
ncbi:MAG: histidine phosphatase family protein [Meiothermus sp.]